jgi:hypothetical protein
MKQILHEQVRLYNPDIPYMAPGCRLVRLSFAVALKWDAAVGCVEVEHTAQRNSLSRHHSCS